VQRASKQQMRAMFLRFFPGDSERADQFASKLPVRGKCGVRLSDELSCDLLPCALTEFT
jgi:hypothetical protein